MELALVEFALVEFALVEFALVGAAPGRDLWCLSRAGRAPTHAGSFALVGAAPGRDLGLLLVWERPLAATWGSHVATWGACRAQGALPH